MVEMTLYGRGGQGGVTLAKLIATAYFLRGKFSQAFGVYAAERSGAPIQAYVRVDEVEITNHNQIREPDHVIVLDPTLIGPTILAGLKLDGWTILNTPQPPEALTEVLSGRRVATIDATAIAVKHGLGTRAVPIVNTTMMGAIARVFGLEFSEVRAAFDELHFGGANLEAAREAYESVQLTELPGDKVAVTAAPALAHIPSLFDRDNGGPPKVCTGTWATNRPQRRTLTPPCNHSCPAGNDVQRFIDALGNNRTDEALRVLLETSPLPGICGRVCPAPCMESCNRKGFDEGVNVRELERFAADHGRWPVPEMPWRVERVAVIGSGPAGLAATYHLAKLGYHVTLFEAAERLGGVLRNGIPDYRLPPEVLDREVGFIVMHGVTVYTNAFVNRQTLARLTQQYSAVFVATGQQESRSLDLGTASEGIVEQGLVFLDRVHRNDVSTQGERVVIVGGGNTAIDAARSARRLGASSVSIFYRRSRKEMPAIDEEIDAALEEGIELHELVQPLRVNGNEVSCVRMKLGAPDASGRRQPVEDEGPDAQFTIACDRLILALGQSADLSILKEGAEIRDGDRVVGISGAPIFVGGDFGTNAGTVTAAIGSGRRAAGRVHETITGEHIFDVHEPPVATRDDLHLNLFDHAAQKRGGVVPAAVRTETFAEVHTGFEDARSAKAEAMRCLSCGVCNDCNRCVEHCPEGILRRDELGYRFDYDYCKGCGICASECPRGVVVMSAL